MHKLCLRIALFGLATLPVANAQSLPAVQAHVPFRFTVEKATLPAGVYRFRYDALNHLLSISSVDQKAGKRYAFTGTRLVDGDESDQQGPHVLFRCYGESCFLYQVQVWEDRLPAIEIAETRSERDLAASKSGKIVAAVAISRK